MLHRVQQSTAFLVNRNGFIANQWFQTTFGGQVTSFKMFKEISGNVATPLILTHCGLLISYVTQIWAYDNGLVPEDTKSLPKPMLILINEDLWYSHESKILVSAHVNIPYNEVKNYISKLLLHFAGAN